MTMIDRFQRTRWSDTRKAIDALPIGGTATFTGKQYYNAKASTDRLNDAYDGKRQYVIRGLINPTVTRTL